MSGSGDGKKGRGRHRDLLAALRHPLRRCILRLMSDGREISPSQLARELDRPVTNVAYHVGVLAECGAVEEAGRRKVRGTTQHFYSRSLEAGWAADMLEEDEEESSDGRT
jgi:DNA-binding transcriptional ArsR family regulator